MKFRKDLFLVAAALATLSGCNFLGGGDDADADAKGEKPVALADGAAATASAQPDFGDDNGSFSNDGECDDMRFQGPGMTTTPLLDQDVKHDASDCRAAFNQGRLTLKADNAQALASAAPAVDVNHIQWGDDNGSFSNDGECDDKRFEGAGMTSTPLLDQDIQHDASDCRAAFQQGRLQLRR
jgi:hypothetical protein